MPQFGGGELYVALITGGVTGDWKYFGRTYNVSVTKEEEKVELIDTEGDTEEVAEEVVKKKTFNASWETSNISMETLAYAFSGGVSAQVDKTGLTETFASINVGEIYKLAEVNVANVVVTDDGVTTTYTEGTDYSVDYGAGMITILSGGALSDTDPLQVDYDVTATAYEKIEIGTNDLVQVALMFKGQPKIGKRTIQEFYKANLTSSGEIKLKDLNDFVRISFEAKVLKDNRVTTGSEYGKIYEIMASV